MRKQPTTESLLLAGDWSGYTINEIAERIGRNPPAVRKALSRYRAKTGRDIPHKTARRGRPVTRLDGGKTVEEILRQEDWSDLSIHAAAELLGVSNYTVWVARQKIARSSGK